MQEKSQQGKGKGNADGCANGESCERCTARRGSASSTMAVRIPAIHLNIEFTIIISEHNGYAKHNMIWSRVYRTFHGQESPIIHRFVSGVEIFSLLSLTFAVIMTPTMNTIKPAFELSIELVQLSSLLFAINNGCYFCALYMREIFRPFSS